ncbi:MAG: hypothetical protein MUC88_17665 [Planctomycetes bacterium]|jgi:hypothetical protein|nr:hypothetical protein [Planctomycetota bacterium]
MGTKRGIVLLTSIVAVALVLTTAWNVFAVADPATPWPPDLGPRLDGPFVLSANAPGINVVHNGFNVARDAEGLRYTQYVEHSQCSPSVWGAFPGANAHSQMIGVEEKTSPTTFRNTLVHYGLKTGGVQDEVVYIAVTTSEGTVDAEGRTEFTATQAFFLPKQDADGDGFPDPGQMPVLVTPYTGKSTPTKLMPMYEPTPLPPAPPK